MKTIANKVKIGVQSIGMGIPTGFTNYSGNVVGYLEREKIPYTKRSHVNAQPVCIQPPTIVEVNDVPLLVSVTVLTSTDTFAFDDGSNWSASAGRVDGSKLYRVTRVSDVTFTGAAWGNADPDDKGMCSIPNYKFKRLSDEMTMNQAGYDYFIYSIFIYSIESEVKNDK